MADRVVTKAGRLRKRLLPAIYFDTSVLIDYWMTEGMELEPDETDWVARLIEKNEPPHLQVVRSILRSETRIDKVAEIRKKLIFGELKFTPVVSPLSLLELMEWEAEAAFKQIASEASGMTFVQRKSKKEIGVYLREAMKLRKEEVRQQKGKKRDRSTGLEILMDETWLNRGFAECHGLQGLLQVDIVNFHLPIDKAWQEPFAYAYLQLGIADIMHILLAQHLGCQYFASFDSDFERVKDIIFERTGISVLTKPEAILDIL